MQALKDSDAAAAYCKLDAKLLPLVEFEPEDPFRLEWLLFGQAPGGSPALPALPPWLNASALLAIVT
jgi:hypothetical protein